MYRRPQVKPCTGENVEHFTVYSTNRLNNTPISLRYGTGTIKVLENAHDLLAIIPKQTYGTSCREE